MIYLLIHPSLIYVNHLIKFPSFFLQGRILHLRVFSFEGERAAFVDRSSVFYVFLTSRFCHFGMLLVLCTCVHLLCINFSRNTE